MKEIKDFDNYQIDENGTVFNNKGNIIKPSKDKKGYLHISLRKDKIRYYFLVHRLVALNYIPNIDNLPQVNHINGIKDDNNIHNLEWCTNKQNIQHAINTGLADYSKNVSKKYL